MIKLQVADYCHNCPEFEPNAAKSINAIFKDSDTDEEEVSTTITCTHERRCRSMKIFISTHTSKGTT